jgi:peroxiredoxin
MTNQSSLRHLLAELHAERERTWDPAALKLNIDQRRILVEAADSAHFVRAGDVVEPFTVTEVGGKRLSQADLLAAGPAVLLFFRFAGCPACNITLPYYQRALASGLAELGASLTAISPQVPDRLVEIKKRHGLTYNVASDANELGRRFGILYTADAANQAAAAARGSFIGDVTGTGTWELPQPAAIVIGQDRVVRFAEVSPDWLIRTEAEPILAAVREIVPARSAA